MKNCFVKELKATINDDSLLRVGEMEIDIIAGTGDAKIRLDISNTSAEDKIRLFGNITFSDGTKEKAFVDQQTWTIIGTDGKMFVPKKKDLRMIQLDDSGDKSRFVFDLGALQNVDIIKFLIPGGSNVSGNIETINSIRIDNLVIPACPKIYGSVEGMVAAMIAAGRGAGSMTMSAAQGTLVTYQGNVWSWIPQKTVSWDSAGNVTVS